MRLDKLLRQYESTANEKVTDIEFIIEGEPFEMFGRTFDSIEEALAYAEENDIPYKREAGLEFINTYDFPTL